MDTADRRTVDRTNVHRIWRAGLTGTGLAVVTTCIFKPMLARGIALLSLLLFFSRLVYRARDHYIPHLYARDISRYDDTYREFIVRTLSDLRRCRIRGHTLLLEASQLPEPDGGGSGELVLDFGVWIGWSTRLISDACGRLVYGFDTFSGLVEDWQVEDQVVKRGTFSTTNPIAKLFMRMTGVSFHDGLPVALGREVQYIKGSTYDTLPPFLAERPDSQIKLFHMDLDTYESCLHALETCKDHFVEGSILVFDEFLVTNGEMRAFYEFQSRYELEWHYRAWGLEMMEMNVEMITARWKRGLFYILGIPLYWLVGEGRFASAFYSRPFWRFWLGAPTSDLVFMLGAAGSRKSVSLTIDGLGKLHQPL